MGGNTVSIPGVPISIPTGPVQVPIIGNQRGPKTKHYSSIKTTEQPTHNFGGISAHSFDVVSTCTSREINALLAEKWKHIDAAVSFCNVDPVDGTTYSLKGQLGAWQLSTTGEGAGRLLRFDIPFKLGAALAINSPVMGSTEHKLDGVVMQVEVRLAWIPSGHDTNSKKKNDIHDYGSGDDTQLVFDLSAREKTIGDKTGNVVISKVQDTPENRLSVTVRGFLSDMFSEVLAKHSENFAFVLGEINLASPSADWLKPKQWRYYYTPAAGNKPSALSILCLLREGPLPPAAIDSKVLNAESDVFMILSQEQFLKNGILPTLPSMFGVDAASFEYVPPSSGASGYIRNKGDINTPKAHWAASSYSPHITSITFEVDGDLLRSKYSGKCDITGLAGASITFEGHSWAHASLKNGRVEFGETSYRMSATRHIPTWEEIVLSTVDPIIDAITSSIRSSVAHKVINETVGGLAVSVDTFKWLEKDVSLTDGGLDGALWLRGKTNVAN